MHIVDFSNDNPPPPWEMDALIAVLSLNLSFRLKWFFYAWIKPLETKLSEGYHIIIEADLSHKGSLETVKSIINLKDDHFPGREQTHREIAN